jgi:hypothetical protein
MLGALRDITLNLIASLIFAVISTAYTRRRTVPEPLESPRSDLGPSAAGAVGVPELDLATVQSQRPELSFDTYSFLWLAGLSITVVVPFLLGAVSLAVLDTVTHGGSTLITDRMREHGGSGYVQYWLGFTILAVVEVGILLLRPWRGRAFGVALGLALAAFLLAFSIPAARGGSLIFG